VRSYRWPWRCLFLAGFFELSFSSMTQTIVQLGAPPLIRGRVLGLFNMSSGGLRAFSGITVGLLGSLTTVHTSLALAAGAFVSSHSACSRDFQARRIRHDSAMAS